MSSKITVSLLAAVVLMLVVSVVLAAPAAPAKPPAPPPPPPPPVFIVIEKKDMLGVITYVPLVSKDLAAQQKACHDQYIQALAKWAKDKADATKNKQKFDQPKPLQPYVKRVLTTQTFTTLDLAKEAADKLTQKMQDDKKKAQEAKDAAAASKPADKPPSAPPVGKVEQAPPPDTTGGTPPPTE